MDPAWIGLIGVLAGVMITSISEVVRARIQFRREKKADLSDERRRRLEELYEVVEDHKEVYTEFFGNALTLINGGSAELDGTRKIPWGRVQMLVNLYAPELREQLDQLHKAGNRVGKIAAQVITERPQLKPDRQRLAGQLVQSFDDLSGAYDGLLGGVVDASHALARQQSGWQ